MYGMRLNTAAKRQEARTIFLKEFDVREYPEADCVIGVKTSPVLEAVAFIGTAGKPTWYYSFRSVERMEKYISEFLENQKSRLAYKAEQKEKNKGVLTGAAACASAIRQELKEKFPGVKFSVKSETYSGGNSVRIYWTDGPEYEAVNRIVKGYQEGHFDGMTDCYEYHKNRDPNKPGAKYIYAEKTFSEAEIERLKAELDKLEFHLNCCNNFGDFRPLMAEQELRKRRKEENNQLVEQEQPEEQELSNIITVDFISRRKIS